MPHIKTEDSVKYATLDAFIQGTIIEEAKDLAWLTARLVKSYLENKEKNWDNMSDVIKALESTLDEFKRLILNPYEEMKKQMNGSAFE